MALSGKDAASLEELARAARRRLARMAPEREIERLLEESLALIRKARGELAQGPRKPLRLIRGGKR
jgi:hypothetical protein